MAVTAGFSIVATKSAAALSGSEFQANHIIDDEIFYNGNAMTASQIQSFLNAKMPVCDTNGTKPHPSGMTRAEYGTSIGIPPPYTCLKDYKQSYDARSDSGLCSYIAPGSNRTAAQIIDTVARACNINQKALLVILQKEQSLLTDEWPWPIQYDKAMGYYCPDDPDNPGWCHPDYAGFFNQVYGAARGFNDYRLFPEDWNHAKGRTSFVAYQANAPECGGTNLTMQTAATAGLYNYTPYQPNKAALDKLYGTGDECSAYGNRNFWRMFNDWFGPTTNNYNVEAVVYDNATDTSGDYAKIGFKLTSKPRYEVSFDVYSSSTNFSTGERRLTIKPENWNKPDKNIVILMGKDNPDINGSHTLMLTTGSLSSSDPRFRVKAALTPDVPILHQDMSYKVYRLYNSTKGTHLFTSSLNEKNSLVDSGWRDEGFKFNGCEAGDIVFARVKKGDDYKLARYNTATYNQLLNEGYVYETLVYSTSSHAKNPLYIKEHETRSTTLYTVNSTEGDGAGYTTTGLLRICPSDTVPIFRLYNSEAKNHFYTKSKNERTSARQKYNYVYEGVGFYQKNLNGSPVYRLYSGLSKNHFYTASESEKINSEKLGYRYEGVGFYINPSTTTPVYRLFSGSAGNHFYTTSQSEVENAKKAGYRYEGITLSSY